MNPTTTVRYVSPWANILSRILLMLVPTLWVGCGTFITRSSDFNEQLLLKEDPVVGPTLPRVYSGTLLDVSVVAYAFSGKEPRFHGAPLLFWDIPLSLAADTVLLPVTAWDQVRYGSFGNETLPPLVLAARAGDVAMIRTLLDQGTPIDVKSRRGLTALMVAVKEGRTPSVQALLENGADVNAKTPAGRTALMGAVERAETDIVHALLDKGADVNAKESDGMTALMMAVQSRHVGIADALLDKGADVNAKNSNGRTVLMMAVRSSHPGISHLLDKGADVNAKESDGMTALMWAAANDDITLIQVLLNRGADINAKTTRGVTALSLAMRSAKRPFYKKDTGAVELLTRAGAKE